MLGFAAAAALASGSRSRTSPIVLAARLWPSRVAAKKLGSVGGGSEKPCTSAPSCFSQSAVQPPTKPLWPVRKTRRPRQNEASGTGRDIMRGSQPGCFALRHECVQQQALAISVHTLPEAVMVIGGKLVLLGELRQDVAFEDHAGLGADIVEGRLLEHEIAAVDPAFVDLRLLREIGHRPFLDVDLAVARRRMDRGHGRQALVVEMGLQ